MKKKILAGLLCVAMILSLLPVVAFADGNVAKIGTTEYATLAAAIAAVPDNSETEIDIIKDIDYSEENFSNDGTVKTAIVIPCTKKIILDLNGKTISGYSTNGSSYLIHNKGYLTIKDSNSNGLITFSSSNPSPNYNYGTSTIINRGVLTVESGHVKNTTIKGASYAVDNQTLWYDDIVPIEFFLKGGNVDCTTGDAAIRQSASLGEVYKKSGEIVKNFITISDGVVTGDIWLQVLNGSYTDLKITGGKVTGKVYDTDGNVTHEDITISGGKFSSVVARSTKEKFVLGGYFENEIAQQCVADGYKCIKTPESDPNQKEYPYMIGTLPVNEDFDEKSSADVPDVGNKEELEEAVKEEALNEILGNTAVTEDDATNINDEEIQEALEKAIKELIETSELKITVMSVDTKTEETKVSRIEATSITTTTARYDVKPYVTITDENGEIKETRVISNKELAAAVAKDSNFKITFRLAIPESMAKDYVIVSHYPSVNKSADWSKEYKVLGTGSNRYVELSATNFSVYEVAQITEENAVAKITSGSKTTFYGSLERAVAEVKDGGKIDLLKDTDETIVIDKEIEFTIAPKDKVKNNATIKAGKGYTLKTAKNKDGSVKYIIAKENPKTDDNNNSLIWIVSALAALALIGTGITVLKIKNNI